jgi:acetolactate synthase-1/2/3 large subunit
MHPLDVFTNIEHLVDEDTFIIMDGGDYVQWGRSYLKARKPGHFMRLGPLSHLGAGIPYAMAAKLAAPKSKVLALMGDGSFGFYTMEYDTCIRHNLPITVVLGNDSNWGIDKTFQLAYFHRAVGTDLRFVRYDKVVEAIGGYGEYVEKPEEVGPAVERAFNSGLPSLVNIVVKPGASPLADAMIARRTGR